MIVLDTARADAFKRLLGSGGAKLGDLGLVFLDNCIAPSSWTLPSHASIFTGMYPSEHGSHETPQIKSLDIERIRLSKSTFVSDLKGMGYRTYCISANPYVHPIYGFDEFDYFKEESYFTDISGHIIEVSKKAKPKVSKYRNMYGSDVAKIALAILREDPGLITEAPSTLAATMASAAKKLRAKFIEGWPIEKGGRNITRTVQQLKFKKPFFLFVNLMEAHDPYVGKKGMDFNWSTPFLKQKTDSKLIDMWRRLYDSGLKRAMGYSYQIMDYMLRSFGDDTLFVITSDHGQAFGEHDGFVGHGTMLYDELVKVPFALRLPKGYKLTKEKGYISLTNIKDFVLAQANGIEDSTRLLYSSRAYAESFGIPAMIMDKRELDLKKLRGCEKYKRRAFG